MTAARLYGGSFQPGERNNPRTLIANWVPEGAAVLEVGPGDGVISRWLRQTKRCRAVGVEIAAAAAALPESPFEPLIVGDIETAATLAEAARHGPYGAIIFADVLEHLVDPWALLRRLPPLLSPDGRVLLSVPNLAHWSARLNLLLGRFDYTDGYLMDRTHLRWFTQRTAREMAHQAGFRVAAAATVFKPRWARFWPALNGFQIVLNLARAR